MAHGRRKARSERRRDGRGAHAPDDGEGCTTRPRGNDMDTLDVDLDDLGRLISSLQHPSRQKAGGKR